MRSESRFLKALIQTRAVRHSLVSAEKTRLGWPTQEKGLNGARQNAVDAGAGTLKRRTQPNDGSDSHDGAERTLPFFLYPLPNLS